MKKEYDFSKGRRGALVTPARGKSRITIRLDDETLNWFRREVHKAGGGNYQTLINQALREHINRVRNLWKKLCGGLCEKKCGELLERSKRRIAKLGAL